MDTNTGYFFAFFWLYDDFQCDTGFCSIRKPVFFYLKDGMLGKQCHAVFAALVVKEFSERVVHIEMFSQKSSLVDLSTAGTLFIDFLQGNDFSPELLKKFGRVFECYFAVHVASMLDVVGCDFEFGCVGDCANRRKDNAQDGQL